VPAIPAFSIDAADPGDANAGTGREIRRSSVHDLAHDLMAGNYALTARRQFPFDDVQISPANATRPYAKQNVTWFESRLRNLANCKAVLRNALR